MHINCLPKRLLVIILFLPSVLALASGGSPRPPTPEELLLNSAQDIVANPNSWKTNSGQLTVFSKSSVLLGWDQAPEVREFKAAALDLTVFGTTWVDKLSETKINELRTSYQQIVIKARTTGDVPPVGGEAAVTSDADERALMDAISQVTDKLTDMRSEKFEKLYKAALDAYERLLKFDQRQHQPSSPTPSATPQPSNPTVEQTPAVETPHSSNGVPKP